MFSNLHPPFAAVGDERTDTRRTTHTSIICEEQSRREARLSLGPRGRGARELTGTGDEVNAVGETGGQPDTDTQVGRTIPDLRLELLRLTGANLPVPVHPNSSRRGGASALTTIGANASRPLPTARWGTRTTRRRRCH